MAVFGREGEKRLTRVGGIRGVHGNAERFVANHVCANCDRAGGKKLVVIGAPADIFYGSKKNLHTEETRMFFQSRSGDHESRQNEEKGRERILASVSVILLN